MSSSPTAHLSRSHDLSAKVSRVFHKRATLAQERFTERVQKAFTEHAAGLFTKPTTPWDAWMGWSRYAVDFAQRWVLFWDTLRQRGNAFVEHTREGLPPVLRFKYEMVLDARTFARPVNYALVRITPPAGVTVDPKRRPYIIIDPRAGHGPGIGGFKDDSQVGVALAAGHPVYFVIFFPEPEPGQTMLDVCAAEQVFVREVRTLHPDSPKPVIVGNCQGGWAAMMLAAADPDDTGPIVINGAPMSYWGGAWQEGEGDNPMRYAGGLLGGTWLASLTADLGHGKFDGAWLVQNFENLNPANTFWDKYYNLLANVDTEPPRFLEFERWWGGFYLMNRGEIEARGQVIVGLLHQDIGHLGIFVSGKVAKKEHAQIVSVLKSIEALPAGLYGMQILERRGADGKIQYDVQFVERRLEEVVERLNRFKRADEKPFEAVNAVSEFNQRAYELFGRPLVQAMSSELLAKLGRAFHPLRFQRWAISDYNPWLWWLGPAAEAARARRQAVGPDEPARRVERMMSEATSASLDYYRDIRDAMSEAAFFLTYGSLFSFYLADKHEADERASATAVSVQPRDLPFVKEALASVEQGGYAEALARIFALINRDDEPIPLSRLELKRDLAEDYAEFLPALSREQMRRIRGEQDIIVHYEPERALHTLPKLLADAADRERLLALIGRLLADERVRARKLTAEDSTRVDSILSVLGAPSRRPAAKMPRSA